MNYELAKQLKDAGFPFIIVGKDFNAGGRATNSFMFEGKILKNQFTCNGRGVYFEPTLSELIDFVDGSDRMKEIEQEYAEKVLFKLQKDKNN